MQAHDPQDSEATLEQGDTFTFGRTFTDGDVSMFCSLTGDYNPFHMDETFSAENRFGARILPGLLTGSMMTHIGGMMGMLASEMHFEFLAPVYINETITCTVTINEVNERGVVKAGAAFVNADGTDVLRAGFTAKPNQIRLAR